MLMDSLDRVITTDQEDCSIIVIRSIVEGNANFYMLPDPNVPKDFNKLGKLLSSVKHGRGKRTSCSRSIIGPDPCLKLRMCTGWSQQWIVLQMAEAASGLKKVCGKSDESQSQETEKVWSI